MKNINQFPI
jgi:hypothetical protein